jgi:release factor glutamine methyltransferase
MTIKQIITKLQNTFTEAEIDSGALEAQLLIAHVLQKNREFLLSYSELSLNGAQLRHLNKLVEQRLAGQPLAYLINSKSFYNLDFFVNNQVLIPRPETELIVDKVIQDFNNSAQAPSALVDVGCGSGCLIISLANELRNRLDHYWAIDLSQSALAVAKKNATGLIPDLSIDFIKGNLITPLLKSKSQSQTLKNLNHLIIVANLPYLNQDWASNLSQRQILELQQEPASALFAGADGFDLYRQLAQQLHQLKADQPHLRISLYTEIAPELANLFSQTFASLGATNLERDFSGKIRYGIVR